MCNKTNQFNLITRRMEQTEIEKFIENGNFVFHGSMSDNYGDSGIVFLAMFEKLGDNKLNLVNLLASCRALGRTAENIFFDFIFNYLREKYDLQCSYKPTFKNGIVKNFFDPYFNIIKNENDGSKIYCEPKSINQFSQNFEKVTFDE